MKNVGILKDGGDLTGNINEKKKPDVSHACRCPLTDN